MNATIWEALFGFLEKDERVAAATIATRDGSTPRAAGTKMLVAAGGRTVGTIGGGLAEAMAVEAAGSVLEDGGVRTLDVDMTGSAKDGADLICGGRATIFIQRFESDCLAGLAVLRDHMRRAETAYILSPLRRSGCPTVVAPGDGGALAEAVADARVEGARLFAYGGEEYLLEVLRGRTRLVLAGGGHVSLATSRMAAEVGFDVAVLDDRGEFADAARFPWLAPDRVRVVEGFRECLGEAALGYPVGKNCFVAILTRGHSFDGEVLAQALRTEAGYVGMIGSRRKRDALYAKLVDEGFSREELAAVHCPIGLAIGAETPEEIAVSIVAELIAARAGMHDATR